MQRMQKIAHPQRAQQTKDMNFLTYQLKISISSHVLAHETRIQNIENY